MLHEVKVKTLEGGVLSMSTVEAMPKTPIEELKARLSLKKKTLSRSH